MKATKFTTALRAAALLIPLSGCGIATINQARDDMEASKVTFKTCLERNSQSVANCEAQRLSYEADVQAFSALTGKIVQTTR
jgi:hypothetical protein